MAGTTQARPTTSSSPHSDTSLSRVRSWLEHPLPGWWCAVSWVTAAAIFAGCVGFMGGPVEQDLSQSAYSTWAIAHGNFSCAYSPATTFHFAYITRPGSVAPLWPLLSGGLAAVFRIGHNVPFPSRSALGPHCSTALVAMYKWSVHSSSAPPTARLAYLSWLVLLAGVIALLRASRRGRCRWEVVAVLLIAVVPSVWMPLIQFFHPQDVVAVGLGLGGLACTRRDRWILAGVMLALAIASQQFAVLVFAPLMVVAPSHRRGRFLGAAIATSALVYAPLILLTSGRALRPILIGSGSTPGFGGSVLWELHLPWTLLVISSRGLPILFSLLIAAWAVRRLGSAVLEPVPLLSLVALSLSLRLVFEIDIFGYYFMALAVALVVLDICKGRIRGQLVAWLALLVLVYNPVPWGFASNSVTFGLQAHQYGPTAGMAVALLLILCDAFRGRIRWYLVAWFAVTAFAFAQFPLGSLPMRGLLPTWFWQVVFVTTGTALAAGPMIALVRNRAEGITPLVDHPSEPSLEAVGQR